jgi:phosphoribosyl-AMP cyclohydrolase
MEDFEDIIKKIDWKKMKGLVPAIIQQYDTGCILMLGFMNKESLQETLRCGNVVYYSRTRKKIWKKGETSGHFQLVKEIWLDCDSDTILIKVDQIGNVCHTGKSSCFFTKIYGNQK